MQKSRTDGAIIARTIIKQTARCMKLTAFLMLATCLHIAAKGISQGEKVTVTNKEVTLEKLLKLFEKQTDYHFSYSPAYVPLSKRMTVNVDHADLFLVLQHICDSLDLIYRVMDDKVIGISRRPRPGISETDAPVTGPADTLLSVKGQVLNEDGDPVRGATVMVRGNNRQYKTDSSGNFKMDSTPAHAVVFVFKADYVSGEYALNNNPTPSIRLRKTWPAQQLEDVVIVGYGVQKKEYMTNAVSTINSNQITEMPATNISQVFAGRLPGILARTSAGSPGDEAATLLIRTTNLGQAPLLVVDGVPRFNANSTAGAANNQVDLNTIDPNEVESISVLKDNAATAVYGARAANGVILITTKRGKTGRAQFSYTGNFTQSSPTKMFTKLDAYQKAVADNEYNTNSGLSPLYSPGILDTIQQQLEPYIYANTDWVSLVLKKEPFVQSHNLNIQGGNENIRYFLSGSYTDEKGIFPTNYYKRYTLQNNLDFNLGKQFKAQVNMGYRNGNQHLPGGGSPASIVSAAFNTSPLTPAYMPDGAFGGTQTGSNPLAMLTNQSGYQYTSNNYLTASGRLTWEPTFIDGFSAYTNLDLENRYTRGKSYVVPVPTYSINAGSPTGYTQVGGSGNPSLADNVSDASTYTVDFAMTYHRQWRKQGVEALALYTAAKTSSNTNTDSRLNLVAPGLPILNLGSSVNETTTGTTSQSARAGYLGRVDYNYDKRLFLEASFREDASTYFAPGHRWGFFPAASAGWLISRERWFRWNKVVNQLKLRGSVGLTGDDNITGYTYYYTYSVANTGVHPTAGYIFGTTYTPSFYQTNSTLPNAGITWAKDLQTNGGLDALLWNGRLGVTFDIYQKNRYDMLKSQTYNIPATFGIGGPIENFAKTRDRGFELALTSENKLDRDWTLTLNANITYVKSVYIDWGTQALPNYARYEGHSSNSFVGYHAVGIFKSQEEIQNWKVDQDGLGNATIKPGDVKFADLDGDGKLTVNDEHWIDNYNFPPINFGFGFDLKYKDLTLTAFFNGAHGGYIQYSTTFYDSWKYLYDNSWRPDNADAKYPRLGSSTNNTRASDATLIKDDYIRLRDLRLSYSLYSGWTRSLRIKGIKVYADASNLLTFTKVQGGIDPETPNQGTGGVTPNFYPNMRNVGLGLNVNF
jgi:TonB-linked SusC/RagA family outer membrane protein